MSDDTPNGSPDWGWIVAVCTVIVLEMLASWVIISKLSEDNSVLASRVAIALIALSFIAFLFAVVKDRDINFSLAIVFVLSNIASMILLFANIYSWLGLNDSLRTNPSCRSTTMGDAIYFSVITWTTVGYGDVTPTLQTRSTAAFEAITGYVVMGLLISVLIIVAQPRSD
jgi:Ion channel